MNEKASSPLVPLPVFTSVAQAERYVDRVAARLGLVTRTNSCWRDTGSRMLEYRGERENLELSVDIAYRGLIEGRPSWATKCIVVRLDAQLRVELPYRLWPSAFEKDARELLARLRSLRVEKDGRVVGKLAVWKEDRGFGYLECLPGVRIYTAAAEMQGLGREALRRGCHFSFHIRLTHKGQQAVNLKACRQAV